MLSKAAIPLVVLPLLGILLSLATQVVILLWSTLILSANGLSPLGTGPNFGSCRRRW